MGEIMTKENIEEKNYFEDLYNIDVSDKVDQKNKLDYLSWAYAWAELKKKYPAAKREVIKNDKGWLYHTDGKTCWVEVKVTVNEIDETEYLPVMDFRNQSIQLDKVTANNINYTIQRCTTKAIGRHGLGLRVYNGEDLPKEETDKQKLVNLTQGVRDDMTALCEAQRKTKAEEFFKAKKNDVEACGSAEEIEALFEDGKMLKKLDNYPILKDQLKDCKEAMIKILDPEEEIIDYTAGG